MKILQKLAKWAVLAVAAGVLLVFALPSFRQGEASLAGKTAQDFAFELSGKPTHLSDFRGKVVVLNFWATWCPPCVEETQSLNRLQQHIAGHGGVVLGISADEDASAYDRFLVNQKINFPTYRDPNTKNNLSPLSFAYGTSQYPETYILDRRGKIMRKFIGYQEWDSPQMIAYLDFLLSQN